ncbi:phosphate ABC transporter membrane protein 2, PhoT family [Actinokineospora alba]|uniref:Phosphate transport system permease protein PstA n=1 Tax=Actinokineospora alba TaxID=504798 RepID=A0A1H0M522_9PSEU|nr:phosphate ABC transporter permease PstA [Actinokineospora alba]TDP67580.1 phosphate ABC transporter membrane protein 2 (PhoT family) [Actinokineospora alba]SDI45095.1 phosphate transport system permease protein [Actinokineospora alba]SDO75230.1 phosphate ABC transporter membrane protein 2, PhoT family [Actinokineospora alba]
MSTVESFETRRDTATIRRADVVAMFGALVAAVAMTALLFDQIAPFSGAVGFIAIAYPLFLALYALLVSLEENGLTVRDKLVSAIVHSFALVALGALLFIVVYPIALGLDALTHLNFFTDDMSEAGTLDPLELGGILHAAVGTLQQIAIALTITVPLGLTCAVFLNETRGSFTRLVRTVVEAMTALPSIVAGLFIYASLILVLGVPRSGFAAGCAISVMMLPIMIRAADVVVRLVPSSLREASLALGAGQMRTVWHVVLPTARSGLTTSVLLATARGIGETSPVLITAGFTPYLNLNPFSDAQVSLPLATFQLVNSSEETMKQRGFGAAAVLMALVLILFGLARLIGGREPGNLSHGQLRRRDKASRRDRERFTARDRRNPDTQ